MLQLMAKAHNNLETNTGDLVGIYTQTNELKCEQVCKCRTGTETKVKQITK